MRVQQYFSHALHYCSTYLYLLCKMFPSCHCQTQKASDALTGQLKCRYSSWTRFTNRLLMHNLSSKDVDTQCKMLRAECNDLLFNLSDNRRVLHSSSIHFKWASERTVVLKDHVYIWLLWKKYKLHLLTVRWTVLDSKCFWTQCSDFQNRMMPTFIAVTEGCLRSWGSCVSNTIFNFCFVALVWRETWGRHAVKGHRWWTYLEAR